MKVHSDIIIFEILKIYFEYTNETEIDIKILEKAFYILVEIINEKNNLDLKLDFKAELEKFLDKFEDYIAENKNSLSLTCELKELFNVLIDSHDRLSTIDYDCQSYVFDKRLYNVLDIKLPYEEGEDFFKLNCEIIKAYLKLGENEFHSYFDGLAIERLKNIIEELYEKLNEADNSTLIKIKMCYNTFNDALLPNTDEKHINSAWHTILFSYSAKQLYSLSYDRLEYLVEMIDEEGEEVLNSLFNEDPNEENIKLDDTSYFLTIFLIELNNYIKSHPKSITKEALITKKYLLISIPELIHIERYYLKNDTIDNYPEPPIPEDLNIESFENLKNKVIECTAYLARKDNEITKPHILAETITSALFIKVFIDVSINPHSINDIIDLIENSIFYKQLGFEAVTNIVDEIIFNNGPTIER